MSTVSIVIPLYNKGFIISETLDSVLAQTFADFEVVIVNDGSSDNSFEIVSRFSDERIKLFQQQNKGAAAARNLGIEKATSNLIAFLIVQLECHMLNRLLLHYIIIDVV